MSKHPTRPLSRPIEGNIEIVHKKVDGEALTGSPFSNSLPAKGERAFKALCAFTYPPPLSLGGERRPGRGGVSCDILRQTSSTFVDVDSVEHSAVAGTSFMEEHARARIITRLSTTSPSRWWVSTTFPGRGSATKFGCMP